MKKFIAAFTLLFGCYANAGLLTIQLSDTDVSVGQSVQVSLVASGFDAFDTFDFDLEFDTSLFSFDGTFDSDLLAFAPFIFVVDYNDADPSLATGLAFSFLDFASFSGGDFVLASFNLMATAEGKSSFSLADASFSDFFAGDIVVNTDSRAQAQASAVAEPSSLMLMGLAGLTLLGFRRKA